MCITSGKKTEKMHSGSNKHFEAVKYEEKNAELDTSVTDKM